MKLHEIATEIARLRAVLVAEDGELDAELEARHDGLHSDLRGSLGRLLAVREELLFAREHGRAQAESWAAWASRAGSRLERLERYMLSCMGTAKVESVVLGAPRLRDVMESLLAGMPVAAAKKALAETGPPPVKVSVGETTQLSVTPEGLEALPPSCRRVEVSARRAEIRKLLRAGIPMPDGVDLVARPSLRVTRAKKPRGKGGRRG